jgi:hypothetical protein
MHLEGLHYGRATPYRHGRRYLKKNFLTAVIVSFDKPKLSVKGRMVNSRRL